MKEEERSSNTEMLGLTGKADTEADEKEALVCMMIWEISREEKSLVGLTKLGNVVLLAMSRK